MSRVGRTRAWRAGSTRGRRAAAGEASAAGEVRVRSGRRAERRTRAFFYRAVRETRSLGKRAAGDVGARFLQALQVLEVDEQACRGAAHDAEAATRETQHVAARLHELADLPAALGLGGEHVP